MRDEFRFFHCGQVEITGTIPELSGNSIRRIEKFPGCDTIREQSAKTGKTGGNMNCVLLNSDYTFLNVISWKRAIRMLAKDKVRVIRYSKEVVRSAEGAVLKIPAVMKLIKFIRSLYRTRVPFSKRNVMIRDGFKCAYCGADREKLTIDHIIPKSKGGKTNFENCISSCKSCNHKKGAKLPSEAGMYLRVRAYQPTISEFMRLKAVKLGIDGILKDLGVY